MWRAHRVQVCRYRQKEGGVGETWLSPSWRQLPSQKFPLYSLSFRSACLCRRSSCNAHAIVLPGAIAKGILAGTRLQGGGRGPPDVSRSRSLWGWHTRPLRHGPGRPMSLPVLGHKRGYYAIALDNRRERPCGCGDTGAATGRPDMAPPPPLLLSPPQ